MALAACEKYVPVYTRVDDSNSAQISLTGTIASGIDGIGTTWKEGAQISAFVGYSTAGHQLNTLFEASSVNGAGATFATRVKKVEEQSSYVAFFPYDKSFNYSAVEDTVGFALPVTQTYSASGVSDGALPMIAKSSSTALEFKQICGIFRIAVTGEAKISSIEVEALRIAGRCYVNAATGAVSMADDAVDKITLSIEEGVSLSETASEFNIVLPPAKYASIYYTLYEEDGSQMAAYDEDVTITAGAVTTASATEYKADGKEEVNPDLSAAGYANCYVVTEAGDYSFECKTPLGDAVSGIRADWVWAVSGVWSSQEEASAAKLVRNVAYDSEAKTIKFKVPEGYTYGNVLIAMLDADNKITYGWHVWLTSKIGSVNIGGVEFMDRNLGAGGVLNVNDSDENAINNTPGMTWQWGRKDAQAGPRGYLATTEATAFTPGSTAYTAFNSSIANVDKWKVGSYELDENLSKLLNAGQYPCVNIANASAAAIFPGYGENVWPAEADPCPAGWQVPTRAQLNKLSSAKGVLSKSNPDSKVIANVFDNMLVMPICGYRNSGKAQTPTDGRYWASEHESTNAAHGYWFQITSTVSSQVANEIHSSFVRCVKN